MFYHWHFPLFPKILLFPFAWQLLPQLLKLEKEIQKLFFQFSPIYRSEILFLLHSTFFPVCSRVMTSFNIPVFATSFWKLQTKTDHFGLDILLVLSINASHVFTSQLGGNGYFFAIDPNGYVLLHPNLQPKVSNLSRFSYLGSVYNCHSTRVTL